mmetsp:Transcript_51067/g.143759  ORF Transcript_51067/g.143759 Transcript_51067/m.143759 type:complete len:404 (-) Transcript_51067:30-1241(-)
MPQSDAGPLGQQQPDGRSAPGEPRNLRPAQEQEDRHGCGLRGVHQAGRGRQGPPQSRECWRRRGGRSLVRDIPGALHPHYPVPTQQLRAGRAPPRGLRPVRPERHADRRHRFVRPVGVRGAPAQLPRLPAGPLLHQGGAPGGGAAFRPGHLGGPQQRRRRRVPAPRRLGELRAEAWRGVVGRPVPAVRRGPDVLGAVRAVPPGRGSGPGLAGRPRRLRGQPRRPRHLVQRGGAPAPRRAGEGRGAGDAVRPGARLRGEGRGGDEEGRPRVHAGRAPRLPHGRPGEPRGRPALLRHGEAAAAERPRGLPRPVRRPGPARRLGGRRLGARGRAAPGPVRGRRRERRDRGLRAAGGPGASAPAGLPDRGGPGAARPRCGLAVAGMQHLPSELDCWSRRGRTTFSCG